MISRLLPLSKQELNGKTELPIWKKGNLKAKKNEDITDNVY